MRYLLLLALLACSAHHTAPPVPTEPAAPVASDAPSLYDLEIPGLDAARGKPVMLSMFYASCAVACPALIDELKRTLAEAPADVHVVLVSFDPARDTPAKLAETARVHGLDARWTLLAPDENGVREIAASIGFRYRKLETGEFFHGATIVALDREGRPTARVDGFHQREILLAALRAP